MIFQRSVSCNHLSQYWYIDISTSPRCIGVCDCGESKVLFKIQHDDPLSVYLSPATVLLLIYWCLNKKKKKIPTFYHWLSDHDYDRCVQSLLQKWFPSCNTQSEDFFFFFFQVNALTLVLEISFSSTFSHQFGLDQFPLANSYQPFSICCPCCVTGLQNTLWGKHCLPSSLMVLWLMGEEQSNAFPPRIHRAWPILLS